MTNPTPQGVTLREALLCELLEYASKHPGTWLFPDWSGDRIALALSHPPAPEQASGEMQLSVIRKWPDGFDARLQHVWKDVISFIPDVKLYDLQRVLAEFGFVMKIYDGAATTTAEPAVEAETWIVVKEHVWEHKDGGPPTLAYLWPSEFDRKTYPSFDEASDFIRAGNWPLGWVAMKLSASPAAPEAAKPLECQECAIQPCANCPDAKPAQQAQAGEPCKAACAEWPICLCADRQKPMTTEELRIKSLQTEIEVLDEAIAKKDAALKACVDVAARVKNDVEAALEFLKTKQGRSAEQWLMDANERLTAVITQAQGAMK